ncbi:hypothetical protein NDU88_008279 [Pleurodeles waltl]|uniref:Uncharacterized protein n=1 Tax=Pleurodeles waltl TaxID=8319 RepID=A0AAV7QN28_PLEWA|nr:hypothetical protein NDU88_008279 [Pleurodeles waltl]
MTPIENLIIPVKETGSGEEHVLQEGAGRNVDDRTDGSSGMLGMGTAGPRNPEDLLQNMPPLRATTEGNRASHVPGGTWLTQCTVESTNVMTPIENLIIPVKETGSGEEHVLQEGGGRNVDDRTDGSSGMLGMGTAGQGTPRTCSRTCRR